MTRLMLVLWVAAACASDRAPAPNSDKAPSSDKVTPMANGFDKARASFRAHVARSLGIRDDQLNVGPPTQDSADQMREKVGAAWAFVSGVKGDPSRGRNGWATADGTVITTQQNLGVLLDQAGVWAGSADVFKIADSIVWSLGDGYSVHDDPIAGGVNPEITSQNGAGKIEFTVGYRQAGPGGAGGGPVFTSRATITFTADKQATLHRTPHPAELR
ncbi:MAG: hypothetical protein AB7O24_16725 [Kofleriaceae bacterium]